MVRQAHHERRSEDFEKALVSRTLTLRAGLYRPILPKYQSLTIDQSRGDILIQKTGPAYTAPCTVWLRRRRIPCQTRGHQVRRRRHWTASVS